MDWQRADVSVSTRAPTGTTAAYVCGDEAALLVDPADTSDALDTLLSGCTLAHIALTHHHPDHVGAVAHYARETNAMVWARRGRAGAFESVTGVTPDRLFSGGTTIPTTSSRT
jgi:glyoxylase-like metal-dependent hydrolase (beta-lactamase superfamily II)